jgi:phospho-N-acetylmuramoyl-pentapeptide-transferase
MVAILVFGMMGGLGLVGFIDDFLKTRKQRSLGLGGWAKIAGQVVVGTVFAILAIHPEFSDDPNRSGEKILEAIQQAWIEEVD